jgi:hypothetical protein
MLTPEALTTVTVSIPLRGHYSTKLFLVGKFIEISLYYFAIVYHVLSYHMSNKIIIVMPNLETAAE